MIKQETPRAYVLYLNNNIYGIGRLKYIMELMEDWISCTKESSTEFRIEKYIHK